MNKLMSTVQSTLFTQTAEFYISLNHYKPLINVHFLYLFYIKNSCGYKQKVSDILQSTLEVIYQQEEHVIMNCFLIQPVDSLNCIYFLVTGVVPSHLLYLQQVYLSKNVWSAPLFFS